MTNWSTLNDAYGAATDIPALIDDWVSTQSEAKSLELWGNLCHQGSVYPASFAAIPLLHQALPNLAPIARRNALILIGAIFASVDRRGGAAPDEPVLALIPALGKVAESSLSDADVDEAEFPYLLQACAAFRGERLWGRILDHLATEEFIGVCSECNGALFLAMGSEGYFASADDYARGPTAKRIPILPASPDAMPEAGAWLHRQAVEHSKNVTASGVSHIFGSTTSHTAVQAYQSKRQLNPRTQQIAADRPLMRAPTDSTAVDRLSRSPPSFAAR